jgi:phosphoglycerol transferase MdoB-like AlkP superfamily enzyme
VTQRPENYSESEINRCVVERHLNDAADMPRPPAGQAVNVILFVVESLMDTDDLGVTFTADPMPNIHANMKLHTSGHAIVPGRFGGSANSEFELLTGMALCFLPSESCPYKQYVRKDLPTLPALLRANGYRTAAVFPDPPRIYNRQVAAPHLGFDEMIWLGRPDAPKDVTGRWQSDDSIVDAVLKLSRNGDRPFFIHAFTEATHWPYNHDRYLKSNLDVIGPLQPAVHDEVKTYVNAVSTVDRAIGRLITHFEKSDRKTLIVVLGDHLPPLSNPPATFKAATEAAGGQPEAEERSHRVPLLIWSNHSGKERDVCCGLNFLPTYLLSKMDIKPTGFLALNDRLRSHVNVLSSYVQTADGVRLPRGTVQPDYADLLRDYQLLQYDLLLGEQFALKPHGSPGRAGG